MRRHEHRAPDLLIPSIAFLLIGIPALSEAIAADDGEAVMAMNLGDPLAFQLAENT
jgi:hypothetical protein